MGKNKYIPTPEKMYELFKGYVKQCKDNPRKENVYSPKRDRVVAIDREAPLTMVGFENYVYRLEVAKSIDQYFANTDNLYDNYLGICSYIRKEIRQDQVEGGMVGIYNPSITQRLNSLVEKKELDVSSDVNINFLDD